jgi:predicted nucleic acid-binding protein
VTTFVIDASIAVKWVVEENGTPEALALRKTARLMAPELLVAECANIFWKKVRRNELLRDEAVLAARLLEGAEIELLPTRSLLEVATRMSIEIDHPAYDCVYLTVAMANKCQFVTADEHFLEKLRRSRQGALRSRAVSLFEAVTR